MGEKHGVNIQRYSLAKNPQQFLNTPVIRAFLNTSGMESLPATLLDGQLVMAGKLPSWKISPAGPVFLTQDWNEDSTQPRCCSIPVCLNPESSTMTMPFTEYPLVYLLHRQRRRGENLSGLRDGGMAG